MKAPTVDYSGFRLSRLRDPRFSHLLLLGSWIVYFLLYFITEQFIPAEDCYVVYSPLDDRIPFCEVFVIPYVFWYFLVAGSLLYFALYNVDSFKKLSTLIMITQIVAMTIYILFPNRQDLRPAEFPRDNFLTDCVALLYTADTSTNVCPSLHVGYSLCLASVWLKEKGVSRLWKAFVVVAVILICLATVFIKQHSVVDGYAAAIMCLGAEIIVYRKYYLEKFRKICL